MKAVDVSSNVASSQYNGRSSMKKRKKGRRFTISAVRQASGQRTIEKEPEELAVYVRRADKDVLTINKEMQLSPGAAQFLLAQQTQVLVTGHPRLTTESGIAIANSILALWQEGYYTPGPASPYTLEETLWGLQEGPKPRDTTRHGSNRSPRRTGRDYVASVK
jgi:hypothetical protein